ncbi:hypothetical protein K1T71_010184 [Dendrolimus kikuchii]|uniref:Uncharacterized protein n=1 Tax=Dendrolimus kikuchii TaxID=765133 RepID=A0ACC1CQX5_9NEOP|nr:hypothetical protein K1T71_010184 [Dendrolimus kikuchii]
MGFSFLLFLSLSCSMGVISIIYVLRNPGGSVANVETFSLDIFYAGQPRVLKPAKEIKVMSQNVAKTARQGRLLSVGEAPVVGSGQLEDGGSRDN